MNGNSSKQVLLSVLGIAILVVAVVGVSFAFFSYTKTGSTNNTIATGEIYTYMTDGNEISLTNAFPQTEDLQSVTSATEDIGYLQFKVTGKNESNTPVTYQVYLIPGDAPEVTVTRWVENSSTHEMEQTEETKTLVQTLDDSDVSVIMSTSESGTTNTITNRISSATAINKIGVAANSNDTVSLSNGILIASSSIPANMSTDVVHTYNLNMYINPTVKISDTDTSVNGTATKYCAHARVGSGTIPTAGNHGCEINLPVYTDRYYAVRIRVVANTDGTNGTNLNSGITP